MASWRTNRSACAAILIFTIVAPSASSHHVASSSVDDEGSAPRVLVTGAGRAYGPHPGVPDEGFGDDGDLVHGRLPALTFSPVLTPTSQVDNIVLEENTGLMWIRSLSALDRTDRLGARGNVRLAVALNWQAGIDTAAALEYAGFDDWRMPTVNEIDTILDFGISEPALDRAAFPESYARLPSPYFWTSTTSPDTPSSAYYVNLRDGHRHPWSKRTLFAVRPVRRAVEVVEPIGRGDDVDGADLGDRIDLATRSGHGDRTYFSERNALNNQLAADPRPPVAILRTGQDTGYNGVEGEVGAGNGDDGDLRPGEEHDYRWADDGLIDTAAENVVFDHVTGLTWLRIPTLLDGGGSGSFENVRSLIDFSTAIAWSDAVSRCPSLDYAGYDDWRLPNIRELDSIVQPGRPVASIDTAAFPMHDGIDTPVALSWWSSTTTVYAPSPFRPADGAWYVEAGYPPTRHHVIEHDPPAKSHLRHARCVRDDNLPEPPPESSRPVVRSADDFNALAADIGRDRFEVKWVLDADPEDGTGLPVESAFQDTRRFRLHLDFLTAAFPETFGGLSPEDYTAIAGRRATRTVFAGSVRRWPDPEGGHRFGWDVYAAEEDPAEAPTRAEIVALHDRLARVFRRRPLAYSPLDPERLAAALAWEDPRVPILPPPAPRTSGYEAYTPGVAYGTVRRITRSELERAVARGELGRQDIVVITDAAPTDLGQVVAAIITGTPQGALSHLAVRAARRGTPNGYVDGAGSAFAAHDGRLVRLVLASDRWDVARATPAEADAWWAERRPEPVVIAPADVDHTGLDHLVAISEQVDPATRFGGKAGNLALLYTFLPGEHQVPGFAVPFAWFDRVLDTRVRSSTPPGVETLRQWVAALTVDPEMSSGTVRAIRLERLRDAIEGAPPPEGLVEALAERIDAVFGPGVMVRFRSSSNAEDGLRFNGAGLYDSTSVCAADSLDGDDLGPSRCDSAQRNERSIERGLGHVWASLHSLRAWEEREWYGIDQTVASMAILVTTAFPDERANGVAFSGDPAAPDAPVMLVSAQIGDESVVSPEPGVLPERSTLLIEAGRVVGNRRIQSSTLVEEGEIVLYDDELKRLGEIMLQADARFPLDLTEVPGTAREDVMLDLEFKVRRGDNALLIKQIRPFLPPKPESKVTFVAPEPLALCGLWRIPGDVRDEYQDRVEVDISAGEARIPLDGAAASVPADLIAAVRLGPERRYAEPLGPTEGQVEAVPGREGFARVAVRRSFRDPDGGTERTVEFALPAVPRDRLTIRMLDGAALAEPFDLVALVTANTDGVPDGTRQLGPCGFPLLSAETIHVEFEGGSLRLDMRKEDSPAAVYHRAALVGARLRLGTETAHVTDFARLAYDSTRHAFSECFLVVPAAALGDVHAIELRWADATSSPSILLLDAGLNPVGEPPVISALRSRDVDGIWRIGLPWVGAGSSSVGAR